jgi:SMI1 / KNR4 family (SUKH-1)
MNELPKPEGHMDANFDHRGLEAAARRPYVFRKTPRHLIEAHHRRRTTLVGYTESEVAGAEARLRVQFPSVFREYLLEMAKSPGELFRGSDLAGVGDLEQFRTQAQEHLSWTDSALSLPAEAVVFLFHQGCTFVYLLGVGGFDGPRMRWTDRDREPRVVPPTFADTVDAELRLMEKNTTRFRERGGYYVTLRPGGGVSKYFPSLASGERPLDEAAMRKSWWRFWRWVDGAERGK